MEPEIVGKRVIELMKKHNITVEELSLKMGLKKKKLEAKLKGKEEFYINEMRKIKKIFNLNVEECHKLFFQEDEQNDKFA